MARPLGKFDMETTIYILGSIALICVIGFTCFKFYEFYHRNRIFKTPKAEFTEDMYKLQQKWASRGEYGYAKAIGLIIEADNLKETDGVPTEYGKEVLAKIERANKERR